MCDDDIHQGLIEDPTVSRRTFGLMTVAAVGLTAANAHAAVPVVEKDVEIKTSDGVADAALYYPEGKGAWPAVLLWPDVVSLRPVFREMGKRLAASGYVVLVPNLYYRVKKAPVVDGAFNFANADDRAKLAPLRASVTPEGADRDSVAYLAFLDAQPQTDKNKKVGTQGYCMGGPLAFRTAGAVPNRVGAVASFHGGGLFTDGPTSPHLVLPKTQAEYMVLVADNDDKQDPAAKEKLKQALDAAKLKSRVEVYEGAAHGWTVKGSQVYNEPAAEKAWAELLDLYKRAL
ncbi:carboxymethylenebutenolidase [Phenylobacterium haematophilum]|jgi:carboxymethylenebutenolidase|uniref:Carboxymethylenebutenolidase n=1 Tax=Phenylobacterium haematophilum TaxID=98513 RepID=A0A840A1A9_9CAUL|nr:dienelactone hydrolase family protein [Phenylobacterium haematophilum]MBB3891127.1 carboxymethylenebutenolidase [Phenylobacterium haematophilum]